MANPYLALYLEGSIDLINSSQERSTTYWLGSPKGSSCTRGTAKWHSYCVKDSLGVSGESSWLLEEANRSGPQKEKQVYLNVT
jgi:hypothetical protein